DNLSRTQADYLYRYSTPSFVALGTDESFGTRVRSSSVDGDHRRHPQFSDDYRFIEQAHPLVGVGEDIRERTHFAEVSNVVLGKTVNGHANLIDVVRARPVAKEFLPTYGRPYKEAPMGQKRSAAVYKVPVGSDVTNDNQQSDSQPGRSRAASVI